MKIFFFTIFAVVCFSSLAQITPFEKSAGKASATYFEVIDWYRQLDKKFASIQMKEMGATDAAYPLHLVMLSSNADFNPANWRAKNKTIILVNNGIHPGEPDGIDASMMLVRDLATNKIKLPENVVLAFIPVYNIGGCLNRNAYTRANQNGPLEYGFRGNSQNLDLNRDFTKNDSREAKSFAQIFHYLKPDIFIDNHVSDGADYQHTMTLITTQYEKLGGELGEWLKSTFEPAIYKTMAAKGWDLIPYVDFESSDFDKGIKMFYDTPRYSSGYTALFQTLSFVPETHMLKPYKERVRSTYDLMVSFIELGSKYNVDIKTQRKKAMAAVMQQYSFPLSWQLDTTASTQIVFKGYESAFSESNATGLQKMYFDHNKPFTRNIKYYNSFKGVNSVTMPWAYIIPHGWYPVVDLLKLNGVVVDELKRDTLIRVNSYRITEYKSSARPYEKHHRNTGVKYETIQDHVKFLKGDFLIFMNQPSNRYIVEMLEPDGDDSFFSWNFFDAILQQKEGYSDYRWEDIAADILKTDKTLFVKLEEKKASDSNFAKNSHAILDFIYKNSAYAEKAFMRYPVYRQEVIALKQNKVTRAQ
ncbi:MAG: M14 family metallopeptidase [Ferruginibacter sp.]